MSHTGGDIGDNNCSLHAWSRTPGKPNLATLPGDLNNSAPWCDTNAGGEIWPILPDSSTSRKPESSQWPTPAELVGGSRGDAFSDFSLSNTWSAPGTALALRSLGDTDDQPDSWSPVDSARSANTVEPVAVPRAITGGGNVSVGDTAFNSRQRVSSVSSNKPRGESFSSWGSQPEGDFNAFSNQLPSTSESKMPKNCSQSGEGSAPVCSSASESGNHTDGLCENETILKALVNTKECWGQRPVDQSTPWDTTLTTDDSGAGSAVAFNASGNQTSTGLLGDAVSLALKQRRGIKGAGSNLVPKQGTSLESNVWSSEPPTGTSIWETHYETLGERTARWKQTASTTSGTSRLASDVNSPPGTHRLVPSFITQPHPLQPSPVQQQQQSRPFPTSFFPQQPQPRFGQTPGSGRGPNGILGGTSNFKPLQSAAPGSSGWPLPLSTDSSSPIDDPKRFIAPTASWSSDGQAGRTISKQQVSLGECRWPPSSNDNPWQTGTTAVDPRKLVPWPQQAASAPQRFHLRQNASIPPIRLLTPNPIPAGAATALRTDIARQLMVLGFHDEAGALFNDHTIDDVERFLFELRDRTGGAHPGLNQLINSVSAILMAASASGSAPPADMQQQQQQQQAPTFDIFDTRAAAAAAAAAFHMNKPHFPGRQHPAPPPLPPGQHSDFLNQLLMRESQLQTTIMQLDKKRRELIMKHAQLRKMNMGGPTAHHSNSMLQEILIQQSQVSQQIEVQEAYLNQVHGQIALLNRVAAVSAGGGGGGSNNDEAAMLMRMRTAPIPPPPPPPTSITPASSVSRLTHPSGFGGGGGSRGGGASGLMLNSPSPPADLVSKMADMKLCMDMSRRMPWEGGGSGGGVWDAPAQPQFPHPSSGFPNTDLSSNVFPLTSASPLGGDRRWAVGPPQPPHATTDFHQSTPPNVDRAIWSASWLLVSDITPQFSLEVLKVTILAALEQQQQLQNGVANESSPYGNFEVHPNLPARYVLVGFVNAHDASAVSAFISNNGFKLAGTLSVIGPAEAVAKLQEIKSLASQADEDLQSQWPDQLSSAPGSRVLQKAGATVNVSSNE
uniref:UBA domain-containing protein n=1 Tax=Mesocestoides corti TaxID=53468 RepID=A0A5K3FVY9_MESCO